MKRATPEEKAAEFARMPEKVAAVRRIHAASCDKPNCPIKRKTNEQES